MGEGDERAVTDIDASASERDVMGQHRSTVRADGVAQTPNVPHGPARDV